MKYCLNCMAEMEDNMSHCPECGKPYHFVGQPSYALELNTILKGRYLVGKMLGKGGFGITYLGFDLVLSIKVAIKEFFPGNSAARDHKRSNYLSWNSSVVNREAGCESFISEARKMAATDQNPVIVRIRDVFRENNTAYIVMDFIEGETLRERMKRIGTMNYKECIRLLAPVMEAVESIHKQGIIHRDIKPGNIMIEKGGKARLLDLGAATDFTIQKRVENDPAQIVVTHGFSPPEQYLEKRELGPWTDVYAMSATIYNCLTGENLPSAMDRGSNDRLVFPEKLKKEIPGRITRGLMKGLEINWKKRIQSMRELRKRLRLPIALWIKALAATIMAGAVAAAGYGVYLYKVSEVIEKGSCGEGVNWKLTNSGKLVISGRGRMDDYGADEDNRPPWYKYCDIITEVSISKNIVYLGDFALFQMNEIERIYIPRNVAGMGMRVTDGAGVKEIVVEAGNPSFMSEDGILYNADQTVLIDYPDGNVQETCQVKDGVKEIGFCAFISAERLTSVILPESLECIDEAAFKYCTNLREIEIPSNVESIGREAFGYCESLISVDIPSKVRRIEEWTFRDCTELELVTYQGEEPELGDEVFLNCPSLFYQWGTCGEGVTWQLTNSGELIFSGEGRMDDYGSNEDSRPPWYAYRDTITEVEIGENITYLGVKALFNINKIESIYIPKSVAEMGERATDAGGLKEIVVAEDNPYFMSVDGILYNADKTVLIDYPDGKEDETFEVKEGVTEIGHCAFNSAHNLTSVTLPESLERIETAAFKYCRKLEEVEIPANVELIGDEAFGYCETLESVEIPSKVNRIGDYAFANCTELEYVTYLGGKPELGEGVFDDCPNLEKPPVY